MYLVRTFDLILLAKYEDRLITILNHTVDSIPNDERNLWLIRVDFFPIECMFSFEIFLVRVFSSSVLYLSTIKKNEYKVRKINLEQHSKIMNEKNVGVFYWKQFSYTIALVTDEIFPINFYNNVRNVRKTPQVKMNGTNNYQYLSVV